jgi:hypothetical protein
MEIMFKVDVNVLYGLGPVLVILGFFLTVYKILEVLNKNE